MCSLGSRIRKIKCDESKPFCRKCVDTRRTCDGYESPFRIVTTQPIGNAHAGGVESGCGLESLPPSVTEISPQDIDLLNRYFSSKTMLDVNLDCDEEARQVLQASLNDPPIRHAVLSLKALREDLEELGHDPEPVSKHITPSNDYGLQQYCMALRGLVSNLSSLGTDGLTSALLCCQIFISIEEVRANYAAMAQHIIRGLGIMHEYQARPSFTATKNLIPAKHDQLPLLDVFIIKLFSAPCKFAESSAPTDVRQTTASERLFSSPQNSSHDLRTIVPDVRKELVSIAALTLIFLDKVSRVKSADNALRLLSERTSLLDSLDSWRTDLGLDQTTIRPHGLISLSFMRLFYQVLKLVLLGALDSSPDLYAQLCTENNRLLDIANDVVERTKSYKRYTGPRKSSK